jgi:hypothetical protein
MELFAFTWFYFCGMTAFMLVAALPLWDGKRDSMRFAIKCVFAGPVGLLLFVALLVEWPVAYWISEMISDNDS